MAKSYPDQLGVGLFLPTTYNFDVSELYSVEVTSPEFKELLVRLYQNINSMILAINLKDSAYYVQEEFVNSQSFFPDPNLSSTTSATPTYRQVFRKVINFGALPNAGLKSVPHGITVTANFKWTRIYGASTDPVNLIGIPLPYPALVPANTIEMNVDATNVNIATGVNRSNFTITFVILEYLKN